MFSAAICQEALKERKTGELGFPGKMLNTEMTRAVVMIAELKKKSILAKLFRRLKANKSEVIRVGMRAAVRMTAEPAGEMKRFSSRVMVESRALSQLEGPKPIVSRMAKSARIRPLPAKPTNMTEVLLAAFLLVVMARKMRVRNIMVEVVVIKASIV